jgi:NADH-quinone oxidoreductase subunit L
MEAPVPASALIHSATLVSAGVYLVLRFKTVLLLSSFAVYVLPIIGALTAVLGAVSSAYQTDVKKILAYSTISHCGFLMISALLCDTEYTVLYLFVHGFFKAASFICIGNVIRFNSGYQDIRCMGGYAKYLPFEAQALFICLLFLAGAPFTFGYFMKHYLVVALLEQKYYAYFLYTCIFVSSVFGIIYCSKLYNNIFYSVKRSNPSVYETANRKNLSITAYDPHGTESPIYYTNTTIAGIYAIFGLIVVSIGICATLFIFISNKNLNLGDFGSICNKRSFIIFKEYTPLGLLFGLGFLNAVTLLTFLLFVL